jgi:hypothetical protein
VAPSGVDLVEGEPAELLGSQLGGQGERAGGGQARGGQPAQPVGAGAIQPGAQPGGLQQRSGLDRQAQVVAVAEEPGLGGAQPHLHKVRDRPLRQDNRRPRDSKSR